METMNVFQVELMPCSKLKVIKVASFIKRASDLRARDPVYHPPRLNCQNEGHFSLNCGNYGKRFVLTFMRRGGGGGGRGLLHKNVSQTLASNNQFLKWRSFWKNLVSKQEFYV